MDVILSVLVCVVSALTEVYLAVPSDVCNHQFKWEDCGSPPKAVIYYYKSGSRCEVGMWRGCIPNPNMFADEYECVQACVFSVRAKADNYHQFQQENIISSSEETTEQPVSTTVMEETTADASSKTAGGDETAPVTETVGAIEETTTVQPTD